MASGSLGNLTVDLLLETAQWVGGLNKAEYQAQQFADAIGKKFTSAANVAADALKGLAAGLVAGLAVDRITGFVSETAKMADTLGEMAEKTGVSMEALAQMQMFAETSGTSIESLAQGMGKFNKAATAAFADKESQPAEIFKALGIAVTDSAGKMKSSETLYKEFALALGQMEDGAIKSAAAQAILGKSGAESIPTFNAMAAATDEQTAASKRYSDQMKALLPIASELETQQAIAQANSKTFAAFLGTQFIPYFTKLIEQWNEASASGGALAQVGTALMNAFKGVMIVVDAIVTTFANLITIVTTAYKAFNLLRSGDTEGATAAMKEGFADLSKSSEDFEKRINALLDPLNQYGESVRDKKKPTDDLAKAVAGAGDAAKKAADEWKKLSKAWVESIDAEIKGEKEMALASAKAIADRVEAEQKAADEIFKIRMQAMDAEERIMAEAAALTQKFYRDQGERNAKELETAYGGMFKGIEDAGRAAFDALFDSTKGGWEGMLDTMAATFKRTLVDLVYQSFAKPLILNVLAMMPGGVGQMAANTLGSMPGGGGIDFGNLFGMADIGETVGTAIGNIFGAGSMGGGIGGALGGAMPYVGLAMMAGQLLFGRGGVFDDPDAMRTATFGGGAMSNESWRTSGAFGEFGFSSVAWGSEAEQGDTVRAFLAQMAAMDAGLADMMTDDQIGRATSRLAEFSRQYELGMEHEATNFGNITKDRLEVIAGAINEGLGAFVEGFEGPVEDVLSVVEAYLAATNGGQSIQQLIDANAPQSAMEAYQSGLAAFTEYIGAMDISAESMQGLVEGMGAFQQATVQMVAAIDAAAAAMHDSFMATVESIRADLMSPEERYNYLQAQTDAMYEALLTETDPATIRELADRINSNINEAWGMLDEGQQQTLGDEYIARLLEVDATVAEKMQALRDIVIEDAEGVMTSVADRLDELFAGAASTAAINRAAADTNLAAAQTPVRVVVDVDAAVVNGGGG